MMERAAKFGGAIKCGGRHLFSEGVYILKGRYIKEDAPILEEGAI